MGEYEIGNTAATQLAQETGLPVEYLWKNLPVHTNPDIQFDGHLQIIPHSGKIALPVEIKRNLRKARLPYLRERFGTDGNWILIADYLSQPLQKALRANRINYLDAAGNAFLQYQGLFILVEGKKPIPPPTTRENGLFQPAEISLLLSFMVQPALLNASYREVETRLRTSKATVSGLITKLKEHGYLTGKLRQYRLRECPRLLQEVAPTFHDRLKPKRLLNRFQFAKPNGHTHWQEWKLPEGTRWGGEPAAHLHDNFLYPEEWTLYTTGSVYDLLRTLPLRPFSDGPISLYQQFWQEEEPNAHIAPLPVVYADLWSSGIGRNQQAAMKIASLLC